MNSRLFNHGEFADRLREDPREWLPLERAYTSRDSARQMRYQIVNGRLPAYAPKGSFQARIHPVGRGYGWTVDARYVGTEAAS